MSAFTGTLRLTRLAWRHDRVRLPLWLGGLLLVVWVSAASVAGTYGGAAERVAYAKVATTPVALLFNGPAPGTDIGAITMVETFATVAVLTALMSAMAVVRHTRRSEETGRAELIGSAIVGRKAPLAAALLLTFTVNLVLAALIVVALVSSGLALAGSIVAALCYAAVGIVFAATAAVVAQLSETSRGANGLTAAVLGVAFVLRALGDGLGDTAADGMTTKSLWLSWLSPLGWSQQVKPFRDNDIWVLGLSLGAAAALVLLAYHLTGERDLGSGMLRERPGRPAAAPNLLSPFGLAWRLQRGMLIGWAVAMLIYSPIIGSLGDEIEELLEGNPALRDYLAQTGGVGNATEAYFGAMMMMVGTIAAVYPLQAALRMRAEEANGVLEPLLATAISRPRWMLSHIACAVLGTVALMVITGVGAGVTYGLIHGDLPEQVGMLVRAALVQLPGPLVMGGFVVLVTAVLPRLAVAISWGMFAIWLVIGQLGALLELPQALIDLSPFTHLPAVPGTDLKLLPVAALTGVAVALTGAGIVLFRRRDLMTA